jgi:biopolymer transport protein ExbD
MSRGGLIIRLIDVALIILFGFIAISDIKVKAQVKLPTNAPESRPRGERQLVRVAIGPDGRFEVIDADDVEKISDLSALEALLRQRADAYRRRNSEMVVLIEPDGDSMIQLTVSVMDICEKYGIPKNINYPSLEL